MNSTSAAMGMPMASEAPCSGAGLKRVAADLDGEPDARPAAAAARSVSRSASVSSIEGTE